MLPRWLAILCAAVLAAGCGSSSGSDEASPDGTAAATASPTATATATEVPTAPRSNLERLPRTPLPSGDPPSSQDGSGHAFLRDVFDDAQALWEHEFQSAGLTYRPARLTIFTHQLHTACGPQPAYGGPFYCPASFGVYLGPAFFTALSRKVGVQLGDFAQSYVIAHELGHHVQTLLGITHWKAAADQQHSAGANARSVRFELQADCLAGVWMHSVYRRGEVTDADIKEALDAAAVVGDDFLQRTTGQTRPPEDWTHGSSAQRQQWLKTGFVEGTPESCDTFNP